MVASDVLDWENACLDPRGRKMENSWWWGIDRKTKTSSMLEVTCNIWLAGGLIQDEFHFLIKYNFETWLDILLLYEGVGMRHSLGRKYMLDFSRLSEELNSEGLFQEYACSLNILGRRERSAGEVNQPHRPRQPRGTGDSRTAPAATNTDSSVPTTVPQHTDN